MFLIDTNIVSESRKVVVGKADPGVTTWLGQVDPSSVFLSTMTLFELERGVLLLERRGSLQGSTLRRWLDQVVRPGFAGRFLALTEDVAICCASLHVPDPRSERDAWIAATAIIHGLTVVTRNVADFRFTGVPLLNPWAANEHEAKPD